MEIIRVNLHLRNPDNPVRIKREPQVFPAQSYATELVDKYVRYELAAFGAELERTDLIAEEVVDAWDKLKQLSFFGISERPRRV